LGTEPGCSGDTLLRQVGRLTGKGQLNITQGHIRHMQSASGRGLSDISPVLEMDDILRVLQAIPNQTILKKTCRKFFLLSALPCYSTLSTTFRTPLSFRYN
jgi:hypothetical protein